MNWATLQYEKRKTNQLLRSKRNERHEPKPARVQKRDRKKLAEENV